MEIFGVPWPDGLTALIALVTAPLGVLALFQTGKALGAQAAASDMQTVLTLWDQLDEHWVRFRSGPEEQKNFEFGQLTSYYEMACGLFKDGILSTDAARTLKEHLEEILPMMLANPGFKKRFEGLTTSDTTFANIYWFCGDRLDPKLAGSRWRRVLFRWTR